MNRQTHVESTNLPSLIIGLGTGRCGTVSLATLLDAQPNVSVTHESTPLLPWTISLRDLDDKLESLMHRNVRMAGDIAYYYLPYVEHIILRSPDVKFVCLRRAKEEVVRSYMVKTEGRNHWMVHDGNDWTLDPKWDPTYPKFNATNKESAVSAYWDTYYEEVERLVKSHPTSVQIFDIEKSLNTAEGVNELLEFVGIPQSDRVLHVGHRGNALLTNPNDPNGASSQFRRMVAAARRLIRGNRVS